MTTSTVVSAPLDMEAFQAAIRNWCSTATNLQTIWSGQSAPVPDYPYAVLNIISGPLPVSSLWELRHTFDASRAGEEIEFNACVLCTFTINAQFYVTLDDSINPNYSSLQYAMKAQAALALPSYQAALNADDISVIDKGTVTNLDELINDAYVSRSGFDITFGASLNATEYETYIEQVELKSTSLGIDTIVSL